MKIEKEIIYNIVTSEGVKIKVTEMELMELYKELAIVISSPNFVPKTVTVNKDFYHDQGEY